MSDQPSPSPAARKLVRAYDLRAHSVSSRPADVVGADGKATAALGDVLDLIARYDLVLATGHLSCDEIFTPAGFSEEDVHTMAVANTRALAQAPGT